MTPYPHALILIVDDDEANLKYLTRLLHSAGYTDLVTTTDSQTVLATFSDINPDLLILDLMMPGLDGYEVMDALRPIIAAQPVPTGVLILTADDTAKDRCWARGDRNFMTKPTDSRELLSRVGNLVEIRMLGTALHRMRAQHHA